MLKELSVTNFKSWQEIAAMRLAPITGLFGSNSSGKTSILQLLLMLKQTAESADRAQALILGDERTLADLGSFRDLVHGHESPGRLKWSVTWEFPKPFKVTDPADAKATLFSDRQMRFTAEVGDNGAARMTVVCMSYEFAGHRFSLAQKEGQPTKYELESVGSEFSFIRTRGRAWDLPGPVKCYGFPDQARAYFQNAGFLSDLELAFEQAADVVTFTVPEVAVYEIAAVTME